jgi:hypothetical protein
MAGDDCYFMRVHPRIDKITQKDGTTLATEGYMEGGQELTIHGWDLEGTKAEGETLPSDVIVNVAGQACTIISTTSEKIKCVTNKVSAISKTQTQPGGKGLKHTFVNPTNSATSVNYTTLMDSTHPKVVKYATSFEVQ